VIDSIYNTAYGIWNQLIGIAMTLFTTSPTSASGSVYSTTHSLYNSISGISLPIAIVFFLIAICKNVVSSPPDQQVNRLLTDTLKFTVMIGILANLWDIMGYIMQIADGITSSMGSATSYTLSMSTDLANAITEAGQKPTTEVHLASFGSDLGQLLSDWADYLMTYFLFFVASLMTLVIIVSSCLSIVNSAFQRIIKPLAILPFSCIAVAMGSGSHEAERVMISYLKTFFGFCISGAFMVICVKLGVALTTGGLIAFNMDSLSLHEKVLYISVQNMVTPLVIAGLIKTADSVVGRFF
jgi:hypothetical protein